MIKTALRDRIDAQQLQSKALAEETALRAKQEHLSVEIQRLGEAIDTAIIAKKTALDSVANDKPNALSLLSKARKALIDVETERQELSELADAFTRCSSFFPLDRFFPSSNDCSVL